MSMSAYQAAEGNNVKLCELGMVLFRLLDGASVIVLKTEAAHDESMYLSNRYSFAGAAAKVVNRAH